MLHQIPDSSQRRRLLRVVVLQRLLVRALCALPAGSAVDVEWLKKVWRHLDAEWTRRYWENDKGKRAEWINTIAAATANEKLEFINISQEQIQFQKLWNDAPTVRMRKVNWTKEPFESLNKLLKSFYAPYFYSSQGYQFKGKNFDKDVFITGIPNKNLKVCPYCDNYLQKTELDHFLPKDDFPFISCHPDNLIPSCHDSNSGSHKGTTVPLDWEELDQAAAWFHPRLRSGYGHLQVEIVVTAQRELAAKIVAKKSEDTIRVSNLEALFHISKFWSEQIEDELQLIGSQVSDCLMIESLDPTEANVRLKLQVLSSIKKREIGRRGLAMCHHALYAFAADNPAIVADITRECKNRLQY